MVLNSCNKPLANKYLKNHFWFTLLQTIGLYLWNDSFIELDDIHRVCLKMSFEEFKDTFLRVINHFENVFSDPLTRP